MRKEIKGYGYVGKWKNGNLGWSMPTHLAGYSRRYSKEKPEVRDWNRGENSYLCEITIKQLFDSKGRPIVRKIK